VPLVLRCRIPQIGGGCGIDRGDDVAAQFLDVTVHQSGVGETRADRSGAEAVVYSVFPRFAG
jgi:hypothetical protein